jgi:hypothetical protein
MFVDDSSRVGVWSSAGGDEDLINRLPISPLIREQIEDWVDAYERKLAVDVRDLRRHFISHDLWGYALSLGLARELAGRYVVQYEFSTAEGERIIEGS